MPANIALGWEEPLTDAEKKDPSIIDDTVSVAPEGPIKIIKDENGFIQKIIHCDFDRLLKGEMVGSWTEEIIRDPDTGVIQGIKTTRSSGTIVTEQFFRDQNGKLTNTKLVFENA